jgi:tripartite-type tricarboxylate transporter receptor subunit TctC
MLYIGARVRSLSCLLTVAVLAWLAQSAMQADAENGVSDFYKGKQMKILVGSAPGGGYDLYARALATYLGIYIPGNPTFIVQNQSAAASVVAANDVYAALPQDGTVIGAFQPGALFDQILGNQAAQFDTTKFQWLGTLNQEAAMAYTWHTSRVTTFDDLMKEQSIFGMSGPNTTEQYTSLLIHMFGAKIKQVAGYESVTSMYPAVERGEIEGMTTLWASLKASVPQWVEKNEVNLLVQFAFNKQPDLPNVPLIGEFLSSKYLQPGFSAEDASAMLKFITYPQAMAWPYGVGPKVPSERVDILRKAFAEVVKDNNFLAATDKLKRDVNFLDGETVQRMFDEAARTPKPMLSNIAKLITH